VVDLAVDSGGNVEGATEGEMNADGVLVVSYPSLARRVPVHASQMYASNLASFLETYWDRERHTLVLKPEDEILSGCLLTRDGEILNRSLREVYAA
jgi:NAD(P) transhydrogenase subunit alpha